MEKKSRAKHIIEVKVCVGTNCMFRGASQLLETLQTEEGIKNKCTITEMPCENELCDHSRRSPIVMINDKCYTQAHPEKILDEIYKLIEKGTRIET
jgi:NADH:ubiquinone oxidoreductase subunit E